MSDTGGGPLIASLLRVPYQAVLTHVSRGLHAAYPDLRPAHMVVLQLIEHPPAGSRLTTLAEDAQITVQSMGELVDALARGGFVERIPDPTDRRAKLIRLTERGWEAHERGGALVADLQASWARDLGQAKLKMLLDILRELSAILHARAESSGGDRGDGAAPGME